MVTHRFGIIKTKMQVRPEERYRGFISMTRRIWQQRDVFPFFDNVGNVSMANSPQHVCSKVPDQIANKRVL
ncbi:hypothetical protein EDD15DRAFT_2223484 [Pisolithus albus]|nr:hypothetical protein EDD15DRAFT_2223484 [Pisolithus albus]